MSMLQLQCFAAGEWIGPGSAARTIRQRSRRRASRACRRRCACRSRQCWFMAARQGGPALREHDLPRARLPCSRQLAQYLGERKDALYELSYSTGATQNRLPGSTSMAASAHVSVYASKGRRELPDAHVYLDGELEAISTQRAVSSAATSRPRCRASPSTSMPSTSRSGACWKSWRRRCWPAFRRSSSRRPTPPMSPKPASA